jgi:hypothetical protein
LERAVGLRPTELNLGSNFMQIMQNVQLPIGFLGLTFSGVFNLSA